MLAVGSAGTVAGGLAVAGFGADLGAAGPGMLIGLGCAGLIGGVEPRRHRPLAWPMVAALLGLGVGGGVRGEWVLAGLGLTIGLGMLALLVAAVRSVNGSWLRGGPAGA